MKGTYGKLVLFRGAIVLINLVLMGQLSVPLDLIAMLIGIWVPAPVVRMAIFALEILNLMLALLALFFSNLMGGLIGVAVSVICIYVMCLPDVKARFL